MCSICSKNNLDEVSKKLRAVNLLDLFVFCSINWESKGNRVLSIVKNMGLRNQNVLFIDDAPENLQAVNSLASDILLATPDIIAELAIQLQKMPKTDRARLKQYQELEKRNRERENYTDSTQFLYDSNIQVGIYKDCLDKFDRIYELIQRTNQLNFTKKRISKEELENVIATEECGYIFVKDKFSEYGIVGFYAIKDKELDHFLFSCRTIGMGIEQYVYNIIGSPTLNIVGDVISQVSNNIPTPAWIKALNAKENNNGDSKTEAKSIRVLFKGPCDVSQVVPFLSNVHCVFDEEFTYINKYGRSSEAQNHTDSIIAAINWNDDEKQNLIDDSNLTFIDESYFNTRIVSGNYDYVVLSLLNDFGLGRYQNNSSGKIIVLGQCTSNYLDEQRWKEFSECDNEHKLSLKCLQYLKSNFSYIGRISGEELVKNLEKLLSLIPEHTKLILLNGSEVKCNADDPVRKDREKIHKEMNAYIRQFLDKHSERTYLIDMSEIITSPNQYLDTINHYQKVVYYQIANRIADIINMDTNKTAVGKLSKAEFKKENLKYSVERFLIRILGLSTYRKIYARIKSRMD